MLDDEISDSVGIDVLTILIATPNCKKRTSDIEKELFNRYSKSYNKNSFHTQFNRCMKRLCDRELIERESPGHQQVFYIIPDSQRASIRVNLEKIQNVKVFTQLSVEEQRRLVSEVNLLRKREITINLWNFPLPGNAIISECQKMGLNYEDFEPKTWGDKVVWRPEEVYFDGIELKVISLADLSEGNETGRMAMAHYGWDILGTSREKIALCCRLKNLAQSIEDTIEAYLEYVKGFFPPEKWALIETDTRKDPWVASCRFTPLIKMFENKE